MTPVGDPCNPSPCGPNSQCRQNNMQAVCSCVSGYIGAPPTCRPECVLSSDCPLNEACTNQRCRDPCPGSCGINAVCAVVNHNPVCSCRDRMTGDPFTTCYPMRKNSCSLHLQSFLRCRSKQSNEIFFSPKCRDHQLQLIPVNPPHAVPTRNAK